MSEEKPRLSRREMREQGLLKAGREETPPSRDDLLTRTSELQLRRPSRREMRLQREANEAKAAEQSAKFNPSAVNATSGSQPEKASDSRAVHSFDLFGASPAVTSVPAKQSSVASAETSAFDSGKGVASEQGALLSAPAVLGDSEVKRDEKAASTGRSSVFDRFSSKDNDAVSFRDRLVARTREGQREARGSQPWFSSPSADVPEEQSGGMASSFGSQPSEGVKEVVPQVDKTTVEELAPVAEDKAQEAVPVVVAEAAQRSYNSEKAPSVEVEEAPAPEPASVFKPEPTPVSEPTPEDTADDAEEEDTKAGTVAGKKEKKASKSVAVEPKDSVKDSTAVAEAGRYPTDVSMRLTDDDDEEKTGGDRLVSILIILIGVLLGVIVGLFVQHFIFGAAGIDMNPAYYIQAVADSGSIGS